MFRKRRLHDLQLHDDDDYAYNDYGEGDTTTLFASIFHSLTAWLVFGLAASGRIYRLCRHWLLFTHSINQSAFTFQLASRHPPCSFRVLDPDSPRKPTGLHMPVAMSDDALRARVGALLRKGRAIHTLHFADEESRRMQVGLLSEGST